MKLSIVVSVVLCAVLAAGQEVTESKGKGGTALSVSAQKSYDILSSEKKTPTLAVQCAQKGKKNTHLVTFSPGGSISEDNPEDAPKNGTITLHITMAGKKRVTSWIPWGDTVTFAYYGKTEPERVEFLKTLLDSPSITFEFTPFLTGTPVTSTFDLSQLKEEVKNHPECTIN